jgi:hypothetical protein
MPAIVPFLKSEPAFDPTDIKAMSMALDDVCKALSLNGDEQAKETVAVRIIELAGRGERSSTKLRDRVLADARGILGSTTLEWRYRPRATEAIRS